MEDIGEYQRGGEMPRESLKFKISKIKVSETTKCLDTNNITNIALQILIFRCK